MGVCQRAINTDSLRKSLNRHSCVTQYIPSFDIVWRHLISGNSETVWLSKAGRCRQFKLEYMGGPEYKDSLIISKYYFQPFVYFWFLIFDHFPPSMVFKSSAPSGSKEGGVGWEVIGSEVCPDDPCLEKSLGDIIIIIIIFIHLPFGSL